MLSLFDSLLSNEESKVQAFLIERLYPTGWRRSGQLFWRFSDAQSESEKEIRNRNARGVRVLSVKINPDAVIEMLAEAAGVNDAK